MERISLGNTEFEGRNNAYLFTGDRTALVDTGLSTPAVREDLEAELASRGVDVTDLDLILLTHWHHDHAGLAAAFQRESDATVRVHADDAGLVSGDEGEVARLEDARDRLLEAWGTPKDQRDALVAFLDASEDKAGAPATVDSLSDGETVQVGDDTLRAVHAPGHTEGMTCYVREDGTILTGDALLPSYTPNVGGSDPRVEDPLGTYLGVLVDLVEAGYDRAYPGHRDPIDDPAARAREILDHHRDRARRVIEILGERGTTDAWTVSSALFGDLEGVHIIHGPGESYAHLEHLRREGLVEQTDEGYAATVGAPAAADDVVPTL
ncbi:MBL fold metallo-hydrolase [Halobacteriales archaeon QS_1_68_20]|nr:MAG: MBL fold metallo-hydrolase [Halobacteriales archaeon QS_1_68_20]